MIIGFSHLICITFNGKSQRAENSVSCAIYIELLFAWGATTPHSYKHSLLKHHKSGLYISFGQFRTLKVKSSGAMEQSSNHFLAKKSDLECIRVGVEFSLHLLYAHCFASSLYSLQESGYCFLFPLRQSQRKNATNNERVTSIIKIELNITFQKFEVYTVQSNEANQKTNKIQPLKE